MPFSVAPKATWGLEIDGLLYCVPYSVMFKSVEADMNYLMGRTHIHQLGLLMYFGSQCSAAKQHISHLHHSVMTMLKSLSIYNITEYITVLNKVSVLLSSEKYSSTGKVLLVGLKVDIATV